MPAMIREPLSPPSPPSNNLCLCDNLLQWLNHNDDARRIRPSQEMIDKIAGVMKSKEGRDYMCEKDPDIERCYTNHFVKNHITFGLMDRDSSFVYSILMYKYH